MPSDCQQGLFIGNIIIIKKLFVSSLIYVVSGCSNENTSANALLCLRLSVRLNYILKDSADCIQEVSTTQLLPGTAAERATEEARRQR